MFLLTLFSGKMEFSFKEKWRTSYNEIVIMNLQCSVIKLKFSLSIEALPLYPLVFNMVSPCKTGALASVPHALREGGNTHPLDAKGDGN